MKRILFLLLIAFAATANAQNVKLYLKQSYKDKESGKKIPRVQITVKDLETDKLIKQLKSDANGNITKTTIPIQTTYWIQVTKDGYCSKTFYLDTHWDKPGDLPKIIEFTLDEKLFQVDDKKSFAFMEEEPMRQFLFTETGGWTWKKYEGMRADHKVKLCYLNHVPAKDADKYIDLMEEAEKLEKDGNKAEALKVYEKAKKVHPSTEVDKAIARVGG